MSEKGTFSGSFSDGRDVFIFIYGLVDFIRLDVKFLNSTVSAAGHGEREATEVSAGVFGCKNSHDSFSIFGSVTVVGIVGGVSASELGPEVGVVRDQGSGLGYHGIVDKK